jgi:hypothetical protein
MNIEKVDAALDANVTQRMKNKKDAIEIVRFLKFKH